MRATYTTHLLLMLHQGIIVHHDPIGCQITKLYLRDFKFSRRRVWCSELSSGLYCRVGMMEAVRTSETSVDNHSTRQYNPEDSSEQKLYLMNFHLNWKTFSLTEYIFKPYIKIGKMLLQIVAFIHVNYIQSKYRHRSLRPVNWFKKNRALSETALTELHRKVRVQKLKSAT
jgi:hypothetical protein